MRFSFLLVAIFFALHSPAAHAQAAPFGLTWGASPEQVKAYSVAMVKAGEDTRFSIYLAESLPAPSGEAEAYKLLFAKDGRGLQQIVMEGRPYRSDWQGARGKGQYARLKGLISKGYGPPQRTKENNLAATLKKSTAFYPCLMSRQCGIYASIWRLPDGSAIALRLEGLSSDSGRLVVTAEGPEFQSVLSKR